MNENKRAKGSSAGTCSATEVGIPLRAHATVAYVASAWAVLVDAVVGIEDIEARKALVRDRIPFLVESCVNLADLTEQELAK